MFRNPRKDKGHYLYFFENETREIIYIGRTNGTLANRFEKHSHLSQECYDEIKQKKFIDLKTAADLFVYETYYINKIKPKYNIDSKAEDELSPELVLPEYALRAYENDSEQKYDIITSLWNQGKSVGDICKETGKNKTTVKRILKEATDGGNCDYSSAEGTRRGRAKQRKPIVCFYYGEAEKAVCAFLTNAKAAEWVGTDPSSIQHCLAGDQKTAGMKNNKRITWKYLSEYQKSNQNYNPAFMDE
jgi:hypothetical protein